MIGEYGYYLTTFSAAINYILSLDGKTLKLGIISSKAFWFFYLVLNN